MHSNSILTALALSVHSVTLLAQSQPPPAPWRGAGAAPSVSSDGGIYKCASAARVVAVRAGRLFDSKTGQMLTRQARPNSAIMAI